MEIVVRTSLSGQGKSDSKSEGKPIHLSLCFRGTERCCWIEKELSAHLLVAWTCKASKHHQFDMWWWSRLNLFGKDAEEAGAEGVPTSGTTKASWRYASCLLRLLLASCLGARMSLGGATSVGGGGGNSGTSCMENICSLNKLKSAVQS